MQVVNIFVLSSEVHAENFSRRYICVCIATAVNLNIQVQMNQWKIVWLQVLFVCVEALRPSQQFFSHVGTEPTLPG